MNPGVTLRRAGSGDVEALCSLFRDTVLRVNRADYTEAQVEAWAAAVAGGERLRQRIGDQYFLVAEGPDGLAGFGSITPGGQHLDLLYVGRGHLGQGVGSALYEALEAYARAQGSPLITADVSLTARRFFERRGFVELRKGKVVLGEVVLPNFRMELRLSPGAS